VLIATVISIIIGILFFGFLILIHEIGHFSAARAFKVRVSEFSMGMGPRLLKKKKGETLYSLKAIPFGGSVLMDEDEDKSEDPRAFVNQKPWKRFIILFAGAFMNILCGVIIMGVIVAMVPTIASTRVGGFRDDTAIMQEQGLQAGDQILRVNGRRVYTAIDIDFLFHRSQDSSTVDLVVRRDGSTVRLDAIQLSQFHMGDYELFYFHDFYLEDYARKTAGVMIRETFTQSISMARMIWLSLFDLITGQFGLRDMSGPVGLVAIVSDTAQQVQESVAEQDHEAVAQSMRWLLLLLAMISINIGFMNLLPLPALDGGRIFFCLIEMVFRKPVPKKYEGWVHAVGFALLMALMVVITFSDIWGLITGR